MIEVGIVGNGGRELAIKWKLEQEGANVHLLPAGDINGCLDQAQEKKLDLTIVGPEAPLIAGIVDRFQESGQRIFGPTARAAFHENDKAKSVEFMARHGVPHPYTEVFYDQDRAYQSFQSSNWGNEKPVIKRVGPLGGKGVTLPNDNERALLDIRAAFTAGDQKILLQERLIGKELSIIAFSDGENVVPMITAQDNKLLNKLNTGGMGAFCPVPWVGQDLGDQITREILKPTVTGMAEDGNPFVGALYAGLMVTREGLLTPRNLEFNIRFGDPEAEVLLMCMDSGLLTPINACIDGNLKSSMLEFKQGFATCLVLALPGYPGTVTDGLEVRNLQKFNGPNFRAFPSGCDLVNRKWIANKGRAVTVTAYDRTLDDARNKVYDAIDGENGIGFDGMQYLPNITEGATIPPA